MSRSLSPSSANDYPVSRAIAELIDEILYSNRQEISRMTNILDLNLMADEDLIDYAGFYGLDISQFSTSDGDINRNALKRWRHIIKNRGTAYAVELMFRTNWELYNENPTEAHVYYGENAPVSVAGDCGGIDGIIYVVVNGDEFRIPDGMLGEVVPAGYRIEPSFFSDYGFAYDRWVFSTEEENRGRFPKKLAYSSHGIELDENGVPLNKVLDEDDPFYGIGDDDKRKEDWTVYERSDIDYRGFGWNYPSPRPYAKKIKPTPSDNDLPEGFGNEPPMESSESVFNNATWPFPKDGLETEWENACNGAHGSDNDGIERMDLTRFGVPVKAGESREIYFQDAEFISVDGSEPECSDRRYPCDVFSIVVGGTISDNGFSTENQNINVTGSDTNGPIYSNRYAYSCGLHNCDIYSSVSKRNTRQSKTDYFHTSHYGKGTVRTEKADSDKYAVMNSYGRTSETVYGYKIDFCSDSYITNEYGHENNVAEGYPEEETEQIERFGKRFVERYAGYYELPFFIGLYDCIMVNEESVDFRISSVQGMYGSGANVAVSSGMIPESWMDILDNENDFELKNGTMSKPFTYVENIDGVERRMYRPYEFMKNGFPTKTNEGKNLLLGIKGKGAILKQEYEEKSLSAGFECGKFRCETDGKSIDGVVFGNLFCQYVEVELVEEVFDGDKSLKASAFTSRNF